MPGSSSQGIFLSYRREDAAPYARLLQHELRERFPDAQVFMDLDSIEPGVPFAKAIRGALESSAVLVALIGRQWLTMADGEGHRRLDNPGDFVRLEVQTALERGVRVIPVLVDGVQALRQQELPLGLQELAELQALELSYIRYDYDAGRLLDLIQRVLDTAAEEPPIKPQQLQVDELLQSLLENPPASQDNEMLLIDSRQLPPANRLLTAEISLLDERDLGRYFKAIWSRLGWMLRLAENIESQNETWAEDSYTGMKELKERAESWGGSALTEALGVWLSTNRGLRNQGWGTYNTWSEKSGEDRREQLKKAQYLLIRLEEELGRHHVTRN